MILKIQQTKKELFSAAFDILHKEERVGTISVSGKLGSMEADIRVNVFGNIFTMKYAGGLFAEQKIKKDIKAIENIVSVMQRMMVDISIRLIGNKNCF